MCDLCVINSVTQRMLKQAPTDGIDSRRNFLKRAAIGASVGQMREQRLLSLHPSTVVDQVALAG